VVLMTGRHHTTAVLYYYELGLNRPVICCNRTYVFEYANAGVVEHNASSKNNAREFIRIAEVKHFKLVCTSKTLCYAPVPERLPAWNARPTGLQGITTISI